jgi:hypothetical protein
LAEIAPPAVAAWQLVTLTAVSSRRLAKVSLHTLTVLSYEPLTMRLLSGEYATDLTLPVWPLPVASGPAARLLASHTLTVLSSEPLMMRLPSGEYATDLT